MGEKTRLEPDQKEMMNKPVQEHRSGQVYKIEDDRIRLVGIEPDDPG